MDNIIKQIVEIDRLARHKLDEAKLSKQEKLKELETQQKQIRDDLHARAERRLRIFRETERKFTDEQAVAIEEEKQRKIAALDELYEKNHLDWEAEILKRIFG